MKHTQLVKIALATSAAVLVAACGNMNKLDSNGNIATPNVKWGDPQKATFRTSGSQNAMWKSPGELDQVKNLRTKAQAYALLGKPHYNEGFRVREWNYDINHNTPNGVEICQLKLLFNTKMEITGHMWNPADCMVDKPVQVPVVEKPVEKFNLRTDFLFDFDKSTLRPEGIQALTEVASKINAHESIKEIVIVGHTDRLGTDQYNKVLSEKRALAVANFLISKGVPSYKMKAFGAGEAYPVKECEGTKATEALKACLADNRRVEIAVE